MFITKDAELLPPWLRFVDGVVDTEDLPLNVSREMLQSTPVLARIRKALTNRVLGELKSAAKEPERYQKFWDVFGAVFKEGIWEDAEYRQELAPLIRARSSTVEGLTSLPDYVSRMKEGQEAIYFLAGDDASAMARSAQLEGFRARGLEVLLLSDPIDAFWPERLAAFEGKPLRSVTQGLADLSKFAPEQAAEGEPADVAALVIELKAALGEAVGDVRATDRLTDSAVVLAAGAGGPDLAMQRLLRRAGRTGGYQAPPILEVNPRHPLIASLAGVASAGGDLKEQAGILLDLARIQDGEAPRDPTAFARAVELALAKA
jgi:molecular chaperone HtpG